MSNYNIGIQKARGGHRVVIYSADNGKLLLSGETLKNLFDAIMLRNSIADVWADKRNSLSVTLDTIPLSHKWPKNSGPKKKKK